MYVNKKNQRTIHNAALVSPRVAAFQEIHLTTLRATQVPDARKLVSNAMERYLFNEPCSYIRTCT